MAAVQLAIFVLDASGSMNLEVAGAPQKTTKAWQIEEMLCLPLSEPLATASDRKAVLDTCGVMARLQNSQRADFIDVGIVRYDTRVKVYQEVRPITEWELSPPGTKLDPNQGQHYLLGGEPFDLLANMGGWTDIAAGLQEANEMKNAYIEHYQNQPGYEAFVTIILMSDMQPNVGAVNAPLKVAAEIKNTTITPRGREQTLLAAVAFGDDADLDLMRQIATSTDYAMKTTDPQELRNFFLKSASAQLGL